jgi:hypothetical protein
MRKVPIEKPSTKRQTIMSKESDLIAAATKLSTASDALSVKVDTLVAAAEKAVGILKNEDLSPEGEAALKALTTAADNAAAAGDRVDAEVAKLDPVLPTPAPAGPTA